PLIRENSNTSLGLATSKGDNYHLELKFPAFITPTLKCKRLPSQAIDIRGCDPIGFKETETFLHEPDPHRETYKCGKNPFFQKPPDRMGNCSLHVTYRKIST